MVSLDTLDIIYQLSKSKLRSQMAQSQHLLAFLSNPSRECGAGGSFHSTVRKSI